MFQVVTYYAPTFPQVKTKSWFGMNHSFRALVKGWVVMGAAAIAMMEVVGEGAAP